MRDYVKQEALSVSDTFKLGNVPETTSPITTLVNSSDSIRRLSDISISVISLFIFSPVLIMVSILIKLSSKGNICVLKEIKTQHQKKIKVYKFRTYSQKNYSINGKKINYYVRCGGLSRKALIIKTTRIGKIINKLGIDELPVLLNILKGDLSFSDYKLLTIK